MKSEARYDRQIALPQLGEEGQQKLSDATVVVIGAGGLGCPALQFLAAAGVGKLVVVDFDTVSVSNLNRQILFGPEDVGKSKAETAVDKLKKFNPEIEIVAINRAFDADVAAKHLPECSVVLDCTDRPQARYLINDLCVQYNKPFVYAGVHRFEGQLAVFNFRGGPTYRCAFPQPKEKVVAPTCEDNGVLGTVPGILGVMQAQEAIKVIALEEEVNNEALQLFNFLKNEFRTIKLNKKTHRIPQPQLLMNEISPSELIKKMASGEKFRFIDIRESFEETPPEEIQDRHFPTSEWDAERFVSELPEGKPTIVYCQHGIRSIAAIESLPPEARERVLNLRGGLSAYVFELQKTKA